MRKIPQPILLFLACLASSCGVEHNYFQSPLDINSNYYHAIPVHNDSTKGASYASLLFTSGSSNYAERDNFYAFQSQIHRSNNFGSFQAYYGAGLTLGSYHVTDYLVNQYNLNTGVDSVAKGGNQFFGAYGFNGGINFVLPLPYGGEWRVLGVETSIQHEFGTYLNFRKSVPDSTADIIATGAWTKTIGGTTEFVWVRRTGTELGYRFSVGCSFVSPNNYQGISNFETPFYISNSFHLTKGNTTGFCQINIGSNTASFQFGVNYKLGKRKD